MKGKLIASVGDTYADEQTQLHTKRRVEVEHVRRRTV